MTNDLSRLDALRHLLACPRDRDMERIGSRQKPEYATPDGRERQIVTVRVPACPRLRRAS